MTTRRPSPHELANDPEMATPPALDLLLEISVAALLPNTLNRSSGGRSRSR